VRRKLRKIKPKEVNFYLQYSFDPEAEAAARMKRRLLIPVIALAAVILIVFLFFTVHALIKNSQANGFKEYSSDPGNLHAYNTAKKYVDERDVKRDKYDELSNQRQAILSNGIITSSVMDDIDGCLGNARIVSENYDSSAGALVLEVETKSADNIPEIVNRLQAVSIFSAVDYSGYDKNSNNYHAAITCTCRH